MKDIAENIILNTKQDAVEENGVSKKTYQLIYKGSPPWEINSMQPAIAEIQKDKDFLSPVLDVGCGYGANSQYLADKGYQVSAIDYLPEVIQMAKEKNFHPNLIFNEIDIFEMKESLSIYSTILDSATFHGFSNSERKKYADLLRTYARKGAHIYIIGFSDKEIRPGGPRRLSKVIFEKCFCDGFIIKMIADIDYITNFFNGKIKAIYAKIMKV